MKQQSPEALSALNAAVQRFNEDQALRREGYVTRCAEGALATPEVRAGFERKAAFLFPQYFLGEKLEFEREED